MNNCQTCGQPLNLINSGVSQRTGRAYPAFWACPNKCQQPKQAVQQPVPQYAPMPQPVYNPPLAPQDPPRANFGASTPIVKSNANDIRENVVLKMISEIVASGKIELKDWEFWANKFYFYKPSNVPAQLKQFIKPTEQNQKLEYMPPQEAVSEAPQYVQDNLQDEVSKIPF